MTYKLYSDALNAYNDIISTGLKHGHLDGKYTLEQALPNGIQYLSLYKAHMDKMSSILDRFS